MYKIHMFSTPDDKVDFLSQLYEIKKDSTTNSLFCKKRWSDEEWHKIRPFSGETDSEGKIAKCFHSNSNDCPFGDSCVSPHGETEYDIWSFLYESKLSHEALGTAIAKGIQPRSPSHSPVPVEQQSKKENRKKKNKKEEQQIPQDAVRPGGQYKFPNWTYSDKKNSVHQVRITRVNHPGHFYFRFAKNEQRLINFVNEMTRTYNGHRGGGYVMYKDDLHLNLPVAANYGPQGDQKWLRATIVDIMSSGNDVKIQVFFMDTGGVDCVCLKDMRLLRNDYLNPHPYAIRACSVNAKPSDVFSEATIAKAREILLKPDLLAVRLFAFKDNIAFLNIEKK